MRTPFRTKRLAWFIPVVSFVAAVVMFMGVSNSRSFEIQPTEPPASESITSDTQASDSLVNEPSPQPAESTVATAPQPEPKKPVTAPQPAPAPMPPMPAFTPMSLVSGVLSADPICVEGKQYVYTSVSYSSFSYSGPVSYTLQLSATGHALDGFYTQQQFNFDITAGGSYATGPNSFTFEYPSISPGASMKVTLTTNSPGTQLAGTRNLTNICS